MARLLETELRTYEHKRRQLLRKAEGKFVLIKGKRVLGIFATEDEALEKGEEMLGDCPFFVHEILRNERPIDMRNINLGL